MICDNGVGGGMERERENREKCDITQSILHNYIGFFLLFNNEKFSMLKYK